MTRDPYTDLAEPDTRSVVDAFASASPGGADMAADVIGDCIEGWVRLGGRRVAQEHTQVLKSTRKSRVYRLIGAGPGATDVVGKRRIVSALDAERVVLGRIAHDLPVTMIRLYGTQSTDPFAWHYLEDGGSFHLDSSDPDHMSALATWLAVVQRSLRGARPEGLPDHSTDRYFLQAAATRKRLDIGLANGAANDEQREVLHAVKDLLEALEEAWPDLVEIVSVLPDTLVHGDLQRKNVLMRDRRQGLAVLPIDWEMAGWGTPAADVALLVQPAERVAFLERYRLAVSDRAISPGDLARAAAIGRVFRLVAAMDWATYDQLAWSSLRKPVKRLQAYGLELREALDDAGVRLRGAWTPR
jgi:aminoglycoside phosphotransferase (APT) family kinase protein